MSHLGDTGSSVVTPITMPLRFNVAGQPVLGSLLLGQFEHSIVNPLLFIDRILIWPPYQRCHTVERGGSLILPRRATLNAERRRYPRPRVGGNQQL